jgi:hypothetical protein
MRAGLALIEASVCARNATTMSPKYCSEPPHASQAAVAPRSRCTLCRSVEQAKLSVTWLEVIASAGFVFMRRWLASCADSTSSSPSRID